MEKPAFRESIRGLLESLAALDPMEGPTELICLWFDDLYLPDFSGWIACFNPQELRAMAEFNALYASVEKSLPLEGTPWQSDPGCIRVSQAASVALNSFSHDSV